MRWWHHDQCPAAVSFRSLDKALQDFPASWNIRGCLWAEARSCLLTLGDSALTPQRCQCSHLFWDDLGVFLHPASGCFSARGTIKGKAQGQRLGWELRLAAMPGIPAVYKRIRALQLSGSTAFRRVMQREERSAGRVI